jgi:hypothetical protein
MKIFNLVLIILLISTMSGYGAEYFGGRTFKVAFGDTLDQDVFAGCQKVEVYGYAASDIYAGCETVTIEGKVEDDVLVGCRNFTLTGIINDGLIVFAETITIDGTVRGDVMAFGKEVRLTERAKIGGNVITGCGSFIQDGAPITGFIFGGAGYAYLNGPVGEDVELEVNNIEFGNEYASGDGTFITVPEGFDESSLSVRPDNLELEFEKDRLFFQKTFFYWALAAFFVTGILIILIFRNSSKDYITFAGSNIPSSLGAGAVFLFVTPAIVTITSLFIVTIPAAMIVFAFYLILIYLSFIFTAAQIGDYVWKQVRKPDGGYGLYLPLLIGLIILCLIMQVPYLAWLFGLIFICFGSGSMIMYIWHTKRNGNTVAA